MARPPSPSPVAVLLPVPFAISRMPGLGRLPSHGRRARGTPPGPAGGPRSRLLAGEPDPTSPACANWADDLRNTDPDRLSRPPALAPDHRRGGGCGGDEALRLPGRPAAWQRRSSGSARSRPTVASRSRRDATRFRSSSSTVGDAHQPMHAGDRDDAGGKPLPGQPAHADRPEAYARNRLRRRRDGYQPALDLGLTSCAAAPRPTWRPFTRTGDALPWPSCPAPSAHDVMPMAGPRSPAG